MNSQAEQEHRPENSHTINEFKNAFHGGSFPRTSNRTTGRHFVCGILQSCSATCEKRLNIRRIRTWMKTRNVSRDADVSGHSYGHEAEVELEESFDSQRIP